MKRLAISLGIVVALEAVAALAYTIMYGWPGLFDEQAAQGTFFLILAVGVMIYVLSFMPPDHPRLDPEPFAPDPSHPEILDELHENPESSFSRRYHPDEVIMDRVLYGEASVLETMFFHQHTKECGRCMAVYEHRRKKFTQQGRVEAP